VSFTQKKRISIGDAVYALWHGDSVFTVISEVQGKPLPHFVCKLSSIYAVEESWIFPLIHLSAEPISKLTGTSNRKQLSLFTNGNISDPQGSTAKGEERA
jgi:hypothetical protein